MLLFTPITILLLVATCSFTAAVSVERATTCGSSFNVHRLQCETGVIHVKSSLYGRTDTTTCSRGIPHSQLTDTTCSNKGVVDFVQRRCNGKKQCEINIRDIQNPDPCRGTYKYLDTNYICLPALQVIACEYSLAYLSCWEGQVIYVYSADYGRRDSTTCVYRRNSRQIRNTYCWRPTNLVAERCNGKNECFISVTNSVFGDPCRGVYKYLEATYTCQYPLTAPLLPE